MNKSYYHFKHGTKKPRHKLKIAVACLCLGVMGFGSLRAADMRPDTSDVTPLASSLEQVATRPATITPIKLPNPLPWPETGIAAYSVPTDKLAVASEDKDSPVPIASLAKIITVLAVMQAKPLEPGQQGPSITLTEFILTLFANAGDKELKQLAEQELKERPKPGRPWDK